MKKLISFTVEFLFLSCFILFGQGTNLATDSIIEMLCKKWEIDYAIIGGVKVDKISGSPEINYEFNRDKTLFMTGNDPNDKTKGTWRYNLNKRIINLIVNGKNNLDIISLKDNELIVLAKAKETSSKNLVEVKFFYKIKPD